MWILKHCLLRNRTTVSNYLFVRRHFALVDLTGHPISSGEAHKNEERTWQGFWKAPLPRPDALDEWVFVPQSTFRLNFNVDHDETGITSFQIVIVGTIRLAESPRISLMKLDEQYWIWRGGHFTSTGFYNRIKVPRSGFSPILISYQANKKP